jgi:Tn3 transposase DDE domain
MAVFMQRDTRRAIARQHSKAESLHALHERLFHGHHGTVRLHTLERQSTQAHCLHLVANAVVYWNTIYTQLALDDLSRVPAGDELAGLTPTLFEHVNPLGTYTFNTTAPPANSARCASHKRPNFH